MSLLHLHCQLVMVKGKLILVSSRLKAGENNICFIFINIFLRLILTEHWLLLYLDQEYYFKMFLQCPPPIVLWSTLQIWLSMLDLNFLWMELNFSEISRSSLSGSSGHGTRQDLAWNLLFLPCLKCVSHGQGVLSLVYLPGLLTLLNLREEQKHNPSFSFSLLTK